MRFDELSVIYPEIVSLYESVVMEIDNNASVPEVIKNVQKKIAVMILPIHRRMVLNRLERWAEIVTANRQPECDQVSLFDNTTFAATPKLGMEMNSSYD